MNQIRLLHANEIDCRVAQIARNGSAVSLLLYKDARVDMNILDETFGPMNWQRHHSRENANCIVSIWDAEKKQWIEKEDTGTESNTEAEKGLASDSFKRACFNVGIGRELYTAPQIWIRKPNVEIKDDGNGRYKCFDRFEVSEIDYNENREICRLVIVNAQTKSVVYEFGKPSSEPRKGTSRGLERIADKDVDQPAKTAEKPLAGRDSASSKQMATDEQKKYIRDNASDADYEQLMLDYGANLETLTANEAAAEINKIDGGKPKPPKCERCDKIITGVALPDGTLMSASELIGKSKLKYGGIYCIECAKALKAASEQKAG